MNPRPPSSVETHVKHTESFAGRTLLTIARQRPGFDEARCRLVLEQLDTAELMRDALRETLAPHVLNELQFGVLLVLFAIAPTAALAADLAHYTAVSRSAVIAALDALIERQLVSRRRTATDQRTFEFRLTPRGGRAIDRALLDYLRCVGGIGRFVSSAELRLLLQASLRLREGALHEIA